MTACIIHDLSISVHILAFQDQYILHEDELNGYFHIAQEYEPIHPDTRLTAKIGVNRS